MALQTSGAISLNQIHVEAGGTSGTTATINDSDIRGLINKASGATMSFSEWYGASAAQDFVVTQGSSTNPYTSYYGYNGNSPTIGSRSPTGYTNGSGTLRTITGLYALGTSAGTYFYCTMSHSTANGIPANDFSTLTMTCNGTVTTLTSAEAYSTTIAGGYQRSWFWSTSYGLDSTEESNIAAEWDGSGNITVSLAT